MHILTLRKRMQLVNNVLRCAIAYYDAEEADLVTDVDRIEKALGKAVKELVKHEEKHGPLTVGDVVRQHKVELGQQQ